MTAYRKWGRSARYENGTIVRVEEAGEAIETGDELVARPIRERRELPEVPPVAGCGLPVEREVVVSGVALHEYNSATWTERVHRVHVAVTNARFRMLLDELPSAELLALFARLEHRVETPPRLTLAPRVTASVLHTLRVDLVQRAGDTPDGYGRPVESRPALGEPPNWWRPSYRVRPVRTWFNRMALPFGRLDDTAPRAEAVLDGGEVLCVEGGEVFACPLRAGHVLAAGGAERWYPYGAGAWGADMLLESER